MALPLELCEALRVLPEVREHEPATGDAYFYRAAIDSEPWTGPVVCFDGDACDVIEGGRCFLHEWRERLWCPALSDLLVLALAFSAQLRWGNRDFRQSPLFNPDAGLGHDDFALRYDAEFAGWTTSHREPDGAVVSVCVSWKTPEEAVARWLLARVREGMARIGT